MAFTNVYDDTFPADTELANLIGSNLRQVRLDVQQRMAAITGVSTALPPFGSDAQPSNWNGILCFATDNGHLYQFNGSTWVDITSTFLAARIMGAISTSPGGLAGGETVYGSCLGFFYTNTETAVQEPLPVAGTFTSLYVRTTTAQPSTGTLAITLRLAGVSQSLTLTIAAGAAAGVYSATSSVPFTAGQLVDLQIVNGASSTSAAIQSVTLGF